jgi:hypothetical protein
MFKLETFVEDCLAAVKEDPTHKATSEVIKRAFADPGAILNELGEPTGPGIQPIYNSPELTILNLVWKPSITIMPHNHEMWAVIGIADDPDGHIEAAGAKSMRTGDVTPMGPDIIHSVTNPIPKLTGAIHVYGGDFFGVDRSEWDPEELSEQPYDMEKARALFRC